MKKFFLTLVIFLTAGSAVAENGRLDCTTFNGGNKVFHFLIDVDRDRKIVLVDGQFTTEVSISDFHVSFVLADGNESYNFNIYPNGRLIAIHASNKSTLLMQCT
ncbi:hypothetical protein [Rhodoferax sp. GW822-FHT02A01]|uniref:hypothetical protein n=1 Tax=Rhodoferax sp. GW822-FHT02A01 TaxID=3141537 RepID=UPI00315CD182